LDSQQLTTDGYSRLQGSVCGGGLFHTAANHEGYVLERFIYLMSKEG